MSDTRIDLSNSKLTSLESTPLNVEELRISSNKISDLYFLKNMSKLRSLGCSYTHITSFEGCPQSVSKIVACFTLLNTLKGLPKELDILYASNAKITNTKYCPKIKNLDLSGNILEDIEDLNDDIEILCICNNPTLKKIPSKLPSSLKIFRCSGCTSLPSSIYNLLPDSIELVECSKNNHENTPEVKNLILKGVEVIF